MFCPKCGSMLVPKKKDGKTVMSCSCGYTSSDTEQAIIKEKVKDDQPEIEVIEKEIEVLPITAADCPKCGHGKAYYWLVQTRASDEPETKFLKCEKCKHTWRDYS